MGDLHRILEKRLEHAEGTCAARGRRKPQSTESNGGKRRRSLRGLVSSETVIMFPGFDRKLQLSLERRLPKATKESWGR